MKTVRYRVRKETRKTFLIVDTETKEVIATHTDPHEAHMQAGTMNYQHRLDLRIKLRKLRLQERQGTHK